MVNVGSAYKEIKDILDNANIENSNLEADIIFEECFGKRRIGVQDVQEVSQHIYKNMIDMARKRSTHYPLQYLCGSWPFMDIELIVGEGVLIPRADTEIIAEKAIELIELKLSPNVLDLCSGTGALALAIKSAVKTANITAVELSDKAFEYLKLNGKHYIDSVKADVFTYQEEINDESFHLICSNPPYIASDEMKTLEKELEFEPSMALCSGDSGLEFYEHISKSYFPKLKKGGYLVYEIGYMQSEAVENILNSNGYINVKTFKDYGGNDRCVIAQRPLDMDRA